MDDSTGNGIRIYTVCTYAICCRALVGVPVANNAQPELMVAGADIDRPALHESSTLHNF